VGGQSVSLTYTQPGSGGRFEDAAGNPTTTFSLGVTNLTSGGGGVTVQFVSASPADGSSQVSVAGPIVLTANEYAAWSNLQLVYISAMGDAPTTTPLAGGVGQTLSVPFSSSTAGLYTLMGTVSDGSTSVNFITHFTIWLLTGAGAPTPTAKTAYPGQSDSLTSSNRKATVGWPATDVPTAPGDGLIITMAPLDPATAVPPPGTTWSATGGPVSVTAHTILTNTPVTQFSSPLKITFPQASPSDLPVASNDNGATWRVLQPLDTPGAIPSGQTDGYIWENGVMTVYTLHLTIFALVSDHTPPGAPQNLGVGISGGQTVMRWEPATDNSGQIQYYSIWIDGQAVKVLSGKTFEYYVGPSVTGDTHVYRVQAVDSSGNGGALSNAVAGVPDVVGLSLQQARDVLTSRGFTVGSIATASSGGAIVSQAPSAPGYASVGSAIDLKFNATLRAPLALHVVGTKRLDLLTRHYTAVRVQVNMSSTITASLTTNGKLVTTWTRNVKTGTWILRYALPQRLAAGNYKLTVAALNGGERKASTIGLRIKDGQILLGGKARVLVVGSDTGSMKLVVPKAKVTVTSTSNVYDTTFWSPNVAVVVVDIDKQGAAIVHNLHTVFPSVRIVAVTKYPAKVEKARRFGASAVILGGEATPQTVSGVVSSLLSRV
jgi:hypothetical protein